MTLARRPKAHVPCTIDNCGKVGRSYTFNDNAWYWCSTHGAYRHAYNPKLRSQMVVPTNIYKLSR